MTTLDPKTSAVFDAAVEASKKETSEGLDPTRARAVFARVEEQITAPPRGLLATFGLTSGRETQDAGLSGRWSLIAVPAALALILMLGFFGLKDRLSPPGAEPLLARLVFRQGEVVLLGAGPGGTEPMASDGTQLEKGMGLSLPEEARVDLEVMGEARVAVFGPARVRRPRAGRMSVLAGRSAFSVAPRKKGEPYVVEAGDSEVIVHGTQFDVQVDRGRLESVSVTEGKVEVRRPNEPPRFLTAGEKLGPDQAPVAAPTFDAPWWRVAEPAQKPLHQPVQSGYLIVESTPPGAEVWLQGSVLGRTPLLVRWAAGTQTVDLRLAGYRPWSGSSAILSGQINRLSALLSPVAGAAEASAADSAAEDAQGEDGLDEGVSDEDEHDLGLAKKADRRRTSSDRWSRARALLEARRCESLEKWIIKIGRSAKSDTERARAEMFNAECLLRRGKARRALDLYRGISQRFSATPSAEVALFESGKLESDLGLFEQSLGTIDRYLALHPSGRFGEAATIRRCELLVRFQKLSDARGCLEDYRRRFPAALREPQSILLLATIARVENRNDDAAELYRQYLARAREPSHSEDAAYHLAGVLRRSQAKDAGQAARDYLLHHPTGPHAEEVRRWVEPGQP